MLSAGHLGPFRQCRHQLVAALQVTQRSDILPHVDYRRIEHYLKASFFFFPSFLLIRYLGWSYA
jgi:hypothetical protein